MAQIGIPESLVVLLMVSIIYVIPIAMAAWVVLALRRIRSDVKTIQGELEEIRRLLLKKN